MSAGIGCKYTSALTFENPAPGKRGDPVYHCSKYTRALTFEEVYQENVEILSITEGRRRQKGSIKVETKVK